MASEKLLPCPFERGTCGRNALSIQTTPDPKGRTGVRAGWVCCHDCGTRGPLAYADEADIQEVAAYNWNDRAALSQGHDGAVGGAKFAHFGDPCIYCGTPHDDVLPGPCRGVWKQAVEAGARELCNATPLFPDGFGKLRSYSEDMRAKQRAEAARVAERVIRAALASPAQEPGAEPVKRMSMALERERSAVAEAVTHIKRAIASRGHLRYPGRGSYAWDDERYQLEFGQALDEVDAALEPLRRIACDWTDCPTDPAEIKAARALRAASPYMVPEGQPTHRHKKRGTEYVLLGYGRMQAEDWYDAYPTDDADSVDMREVAIYRSVDDESWWARPREEFEDGRFEALATPPNQGGGDG